jgi:hypothetical protein
MADQCAIRSGRDASKRQISSALWNLPEDRQSGGHLDLLQDLGCRSDGLRH